MSNDPAANGRNLVSRVLPSLAVAFALLVPATAQAALSPAGAKLPGAVGWQAGQAVAISADGTLGLAGAPGNGSARVLARSGGSTRETRLRPMVAGSFDTPCSSFGVARIGP